MRLFSLPVLGGGALITSPALYAGLVVGSLPLETTGERYAVGVLATWCGLSLLEALVGRPAAAALQPGPLGQGGAPAGPGGTSAHQAGHRGDGPTGIGPGAAPRELGGG